MTDTPAPSSGDEAINAQLMAWLDKEPKRFEVVVKHYYDLFAYHAAQRLTTFNFFIVSLSFFSNAYATLATKGDETHRFYFLMAAILSLIAWTLVVAFSRLDKRNEQIILINEGPLKRAQAIIKQQFGGDCWETFKLSNDEARPMRTFGKLLPIIYIVAGWLAAAGSAYGFVLANLLGPVCGALMAILLGILSVLAVTVSGPPRVRPA